MNLVEEKELGDDQWLWLKKYKSINLDDWRLIKQPRKQEKSIWMYIGNWKPNLSHSDLNQGSDAGYFERNNNLLNNAIIVDNK